MRPLLSIAIATKNREKYCIAAIESLLAYNFADLEIAVADNSDTTLVKEFVENLHSNQVKYSYDSNPISSIDNFNRAAALTTGEYFMLIGDDDTILPKCIEIAKWAKENNVDTVCSKLNYTYFWPGAHPVHASGFLSIPSENSDLKKKVDARQELIKLLKHGLVNYMFFDVPKSYHGLVKKSLMDEIRERTGNYYGALSPDIFSVVSLCLLSKNHYIIDEPISVAGVCATSTTSQQIKGTHAGPLDKMPHLQNRKVEYHWSPLIPKFYSVTTTWGDSGLNALLAMGAGDLLSNFKPYPLVAQSILMNRNTILPLVLEESEKLRKERKISLISFWGNTTISALALIFEKINIIFQKKMHPSKDIVGLNDFKEMMYYIEKGTKP